MLFYEKRQNFNADMVCPFYFHRVPAYGEIKPRANKKRREIKRSAI